MCFSTKGSWPAHSFVSASALVALAIVIASVAPISSAQESALDFDGIDDFAFIESPTGWNFSTSALTIETWIRPSDISGSTFRGIVSNDFTFVIAQHFSDYSALVWSISLGPTDAAVTPTGSLVVDRWDHFACTYDGTTMRIFQNGAPVAEQVHIAGGPVWINYDLFLGTWPSADGFAGVIDELRIWNAVRTEAEINAWMNRPLTGSEPDLLGYWRLDEGSGQVIVDSSALANNGVLGSTTAVEPEDPSWTADAAPLAFFYDGFESATTSAWSVTIP